MASFSLCFSLVFFLSIVSFFPFIKLCISVSIVKVLFRFHLYARKRDEMEQVVGFIQRLHCSPSFSKHCKNNDPLILSIKNKNGKKRNKKMERSTIADPIKDSTFLRYLLTFDLMYYQFHSRKQIRTKRNNK